MPEKKNKNTEKVTDRNKMHYRFRLDKKYDADLINCLQYEARANRLTTQGYIKYAVIASMPEKYFKEYYSSPKETCLPAILKKLQSESKGYIHDDDLPRIHKPEENTMFSYQTQINESVSKPEADIDTKDLLTNLETLNDLCTAGNCSFDSLKSILKLYHAFGTEQIFGKEDIMNVCKIGSDATNKLITKMKKINIVQPIRIPSGHAYKFKEKFQVK